MNRRRIIAQRRFLQQSLAAQIRLVRRYLCPPIHRRVRDDYYVESVVCWNSQARRSLATLTQPFEKRW